MFPLGQCHRVGPETWVLVLSSSVRACSALLGCSVVSLFFSLPPQPALFLLAIGFTTSRERVSLVLGLFGTADRAGGFLLPVFFRFKTAGVYCPSEAGEAELRTFRYCLGLLDAQTQRMASIAPISLLYGIATTFLEHAASPGGVWRMNG